ncbi:MAG: ATP-binding cassette domain-containing protein, partial [Lachnospiraceae bacterium]|nr:ATP-binding cassette domain-containing protein [Lachnospiraceae bacterium]
IYNSMNTTMSGGEKQKICLIRMLLSEADIWFLDEPSSALDEKSTKRFFEEIELKKKNHIIIMISHEKPLTYDYVVNMMTYIK